MNIWREIYVSETNYTWSSYANSKYYQKVELALDIWNFFVFLDTIKFYSMQKRKNMSTYLVPSSRLELTGQIFLQMLRRPSKIGQWLQILPKIQKSVKFCHTGPGFLSRSHLV